MTNDFIYTTYIRSTPEKVWQAITNPEFTRQYWGLGCEIQSDTKKGSDWKLFVNNGAQLKVIGKVLESNPPKRLVITWADPEDTSDESQVVFDISMVEEVVRLDVVHSKLSNIMAGRISQGWPRVLSSLKSFLETGQSINAGCGDIKKAC